MLENATSAVPKERWELYRVLSEPIRLRLLALAGEEELGIGELAELLGESQPNVSRHAAPLKQVGLLSVRKQGTRTFVRLADHVATDPVVQDALSSGRSLCEADGSLGRVSEVLRARDALAREYFAKPRAATSSDAPGELGSYLAALAPLLERRMLAIDAGTGDGGLIDVLSPVFERVIAIDRSEAQLEQARARIERQGYRNVEIVAGEYDSAHVASEVKKASHGAGADAVFAVRLLHHAPKPAHVVKALAEMCRPGGSVVLLDYARHEDEAMRDQADLWLGFESKELHRFAHEAGLTHVTVSKVPSPRAPGPDAHLPWHVLVGKRAVS